MIMPLPACQIKDDALRFTDGAGYDLALRLGAFFVERGSNVSLLPIESFAQMFFREPSDHPFTGFKNQKISESVLGYEDRPEQVEQLQLERSLWMKHLPHPVCGVLEEMHGVANTVVNAVFDQVGVRPSDRNRILGRTGGSQGLEYCIFNHFRSVKPVIGFTPHTDSGFITLLHVIEDGLEGFIDDEWKPISPRPGHFIAIFGDAMNVLTRNLPFPAAALLHRVRSVAPRQLEHDRISIGTYIGPRFDMDLFTYNQNGVLTVARPFKEFSIEKARGLGYQFHAKVQ